MTNLTWLVWKVISRLLPGECKVNTLYLKRNASQFYAADCISAGKLRQTALPHLRSFKLFPGRRIGLLKWEE